MLDLLAGTVLAGTLGAQMLSTALAAARCRSRKESVPVQPGAPAVTIVRPVCGVDAYDELTLGSTFRLDYPNVRLIFCCDRENDPAVQLVRQLMREHADVDAQLLVGRSPLTANPKLNNILKGWPHIETDWLIVADSNVEMPADYVQKLLAAWRPETGVLCSPPIGDRPADFWGELECAFLNTYQARWQYAADSLGFGFAQGKNMVFRRRDLEAAGGFIALGSEVAEDAAATKLMRSMNLEARLVDGPFKQPLGKRRVLQVWDRQARWARLRRMTFPLVFAPEILTTSLVPIACAAIVADNLDMPSWLLAALVGALWYAAEGVLAVVSGWHYSWRSPLAAFLRDLILPVLWTQAWFIDSFSWRGNKIETKDEEPASHAA